MKIRLSFTPSRMTATKAIEGLATDAVLTPQQRKDCHAVLAYLRDMKDARAAWGYVLVRKEAQA